MKNVFLLMVALALLVVPGLAQTPDAASNTDQATITGCLGGSNGNYTVVEDGTSQTLKISTSSVDLKLHLAQDVSLMGHRTSGTASTGAADNSFAVTGLNVISEHCAATAVAPAATSAPPVTTGGPSPGTKVSAPAAAVAASTPAANTPAAPASPSATASTPATDAAGPAAPDSPSSDTTSLPVVDAAPRTETIVPSAATVSTPPVVDAGVPAPTVIPPTETVSVPPVDAAAPAANAVHPTRPSAHARTHSGKQAAAAPALAATVGPSSETIIPTAAAAATPAAPADSSAETASTAAPAATTPTATHKGGSLWLMILVAVLVIALTTLAPFVVRWRKRKMLERTDAPNLSLTNEVISDETRSDHDKAEPRKAA